MAFIPEDKLLEIKDVARIEEVVGQYVQFGPKGQDSFGLALSTPTPALLSRYPRRRAFFIVSAAAPAATSLLLTSTSAWRFPEAAQELAGATASRCPSRNWGRRARSRPGKRTLAYEIKSGGGEFSTQATLNSAIGAPGRDYLAKRGLTPEVIKAFHLGYAVEEWDALRRHLQAPRPPYRRPGTPAC